MKFNDWKGSLRFSPNDFARLFTTREIKKERSIENYKRATHTHTHIHTVSGKRIILPPTDEPRNQRWNYSKVKVKERMQVKSKRLREKKKG